MAAGNENAGDPNKGAADQGDKNADNQNNDAAAQAAAAEAALAAKGGDQGKKDGDGDAAAQAAAAAAKAESDAKADETLWGEKWREALANGDEKELKRLERFKSPRDILRMNRELEAMKSAGEIVVKPPAKDATVEQIAEYREKLGIPAEAKDYVIKPEARDLNDFEKGITDAYAKFAHERNIPPGYANISAEFMVAFNDELAQKAADLDLEMADKHTEELKKEWGKDFGRYVKAVDNFTAAKIGADNAAKLMNMQLVGGGKVGAHPDFIRLLADSALETGGFDPGASFDQADGGKETRARIDELQGLIKTDEKKYWSKETQAEINQLYDKLDAQGKLAKVG